VHRLLAHNALDAVGRALQRHDAAQHGDGGVAPAALAAAPCGADLLLTPVERGCLDEVLRIQPGDLEDPASFLRMHTSVGSLCSAFHMLGYAARSTTRHASKLTDELRGELRASAQEKSDPSSWFMTKTAIVEEYGKLYYARPALFRHIAVVLYGLVFLVVRHPTGNTDLGRIEAVLRHEDVVSAIDTCIARFIDACRLERRDAWPAARVAAHDKRLKTLVHSVATNYTRILRNKVATTTAASNVVANSEKLIEEQVDAKSNTSLRNAIATGGSKKKKVKRTKKSSSAAGKRQKKT